MIAGKRERFARPWGLKRGKYAYEAKDAFGYAQQMKQFQMMDIRGQDYTGCSYCGGKQRLFHSLYDGRRRD